MTQKGHPEFGKTHSFNLNISACHWEGNGGNREKAVADARSDAAGDVADLAAAIAAFYKLRVIDDYPVMFGWMASCFDFEQPHLEHPHPESDMKRHAALKKLWSWATVVGEVDLPAFTAVQSQFELILSRLRNATSVHKKSGQMARRSRGSMTR